MGVLLTMGALRHRAAHTPNDSSAYVRSQPSSLHDFW